MSDIDPLSDFAVANEYAEFCGDEMWTLQMTNAQQMVVRCDSVETVHGALVVNMIGDEPVLILPPGSWAAVYRVKTPGAAALPLTHLVNMQVAPPPAEETQEPAQAEEQQ